LGWATVQESAGRKRIPFAPSIVATLIVTFASGSLQRGPSPFHLPWPTNLQYYWYWQIAIDGRRCGDPKLS
jgi:hypothetical protein